MIFDKFSILRRALKNSWEECKRTPVCTLIENDTIRHTVNVGDTVLRNVYYGHVYKKIGSALLGML